LKKLLPLLFIFCVLAALLWMAVAPLPADAVMQTFNYTGAVQTFVVPPEVASVTFRAVGAQGGTGYNNGNTVGGKGGSVTATITVTPGKRFISMLAGVAAMAATTSPEAPALTGVVKGQVQSIAAGAAVEPPTYDKESTT
jgi:hypothetical protein